MLKMVTYSGIVVNRPVMREPMKGAMPVRSRIKLVPIKMRTGISHVLSLLLPGSTSPFGIKYSPATIANATTGTMIKRGIEAVCKYNVLNEKTKMLPIMDMCH